MKQPDFRLPDFELKLWDQTHCAGTATFDGHWCTQCRKHIPDDDIIGPINIVIRDPELIGPEGMEREFCTWECAADWFEAQAGRRPRYPGGK